MVKPLWVMVSSTAHRIASRHGAIRRDADGYALATMALTAPHGTEPATACYGGWRPDDERELDELRPGSHGARLARRRSVLLGACFGFRDRKTAADSNAALKKIAATRIGEARKGLFRFGNVSAVCQAQPGGFLGSWRDVLASRPRTIRGDTSNRTSRVDNLREGGLQSEAFRCWRDCGFRTCDSGCGCCGLVCERQQGSRRVRHDL